MNKTILESLDRIAEWPPYLKSGDQMRENRVARGVSLREEAARLGISAVELGEMERGIRTAPEGGTVADDD